MHRAFLEMKTRQREVALTLYRWLTSRSRSSLCHSFANQKMFPGAVLFYHRVATHSMNDWSIEKRNFEKHLDWAKAHSQVVSLDCIYESQMQGSRDKLMVAFTFDDGYSENCEHAIPAMLERGIPCTYFITTHFIESGESFPHDLSHGLRLKPNTVSEIRRMADQGIQIGAHSHTHLNFGMELNRAELKREITDVRKRLQDWTGQSIDFFAFPYGLRTNISQAAIDMVFESGFKCFVSAAGGMNMPGQNSSHLQRIHGDPGMAAFKNWLTLDPRKIKAKNPFEMEFRIPRPHHSLA